MLQDELNLAWGHLKNAFTKVKKTLEPGVLHLPDDKPFLLVIDIDAFYTEHRPFPENLKESIEDFLDNNRHRFNVIHVWHSTDMHMPQHMRERFQPLSDSNRVVVTVESIEDQDAVLDYNPVSKPRAGEWLLGKPSSSAFYGTTLQYSLPPNVEIFVLGAYGYDCIKNTLREGCDNKFTMISLEDLIFPNNKTETDIDIPKQRELDHRVLEYNPAVLSALSP